MLGLVFKNAMMSNHGRATASISVPYLCSCALAQSQFAKVG
jgi:hypothetical protein